jgi:hypothetical protein
VAVPGDLERTLEHGAGQQDCYSGTTSLCCWDSSGRPDGLYRYHEDIDPEKTMMIAATVHQGVTFGQIESVEKDGIPPPCASNNCDERSWLWLFVLGGSLWQ